MKELTLATLAKKEAKFGERQKHAVTSGNGIKKSAFTGLSDNAALAAILTPEIGERQTRGNNTTFFQLERG